MAKYKYRVTVMATTIVESEERDKMWAIEQAAPSIDISSGQWEAELIGQESE